MEVRFSKAFSYYFVYLVQDYNVPSNCVYADYCTNPHYIGCVVGRVTNRIKGASFVIDDKEYHLTANEAPNHLHGGAVGFNKVLLLCKYAVPVQSECQVL